MAQPACVSLQYSVSWLHRELHRRLQGAARMRFTHAVQRFVALSGASPKVPVSQPTRVSPT
eukprot:7125777-Pyramimonas_sp.AAC.1